MTVIPADLDALKELSRVAEENREAGDWVTVPPDPFTEKPDQKTLVSFKEEDEAG